MRQERHPAVLFQLPGYPPFPLLRRAPLRAIHCRHCTRNQWRRQLSEPCAKSTRNSTRYLDTRAPGSAGTKCQASPPLIELGTRNAWGQVLRVGRVRAPKHQHRGSSCCELLTLSYLPLLKEGRRSEPRRRGGVQLALFFLAKPEDFDTFPRKSRRPPKEPESGGCCFQSERPWGWLTAVRPGPWCFRLYCGDPVWVSRPPEAVKPMQ